MTQGSQHRIAWPSTLRRLVVTLTCCLLAASCWLRTNDGGFRAHGMVVDLAGRPVPDATVKSYPWGREVITDARGCFLILEITSTRKHEMPFSVAAKGSKSFKGTVPAPGGLRLRVVLADANSDTGSVVDSSPAPEALFSCEPSPFWSPLEVSAKQKALSTRITALSELPAHVGEYSCRNGLLDSPVLETAIQAVLRTRYEPERLKYASCSAVVQRGSWILLDLFQQGPEGFTVFILVNPQTERVYVSRIGELFWMPRLLWHPDRTSDPKAEISGRSPIPSDVSAIVVDELTATWGHVATFSWRDGAVRIEKR